MNKKNINIYFAFLIAVFFSQHAISEEADSDKPIEIEADTMLVEETKNNFNSNCEKNEVII